MVLAWGRERGHFEPRDDCFSFQPDFFFLRGTVMPLTDPKAKELFAKALNDAKTKRMFFVLALKGSSDGALILTKIKITAKEVTAAKKQSGGTTVIKGACFFEKGKHVFEVAKLPTTD